MVEQKKTSITWFKKGIFRILMICLDIWTIELTVWTGIKENTLLKSAHTPSISVNGEEVEAIRG